MKSRPGCAAACLVQSARERGEWDQLLEKQWGNDFSKRRKGVKVKTLQILERLEVSRAKHLCREEWYSQMQGPADLAKDESAVA